MSDADFDPDEPDAAGSRSRSHPERRVEGVRVCLRCGHDLHGQAIEEDPGLGLFFVRCPECGTAAALVEYPRLGVWGRRLGSLLAVLGILLVFGLAVASTAIEFGITVFFLDQGSDAARTVLRDALPENTWRIDPEWWAVNGAEVAERMRRTPMSIDDDLILGATLFWPCSFLLGTIWAGVALNVPRRRLPWIGLGLMGAASAIVAVLIYASPSPGDSLRPASTTEATIRIVGPSILWRSASIQLGFMILGLLVGRPILRGFARFILPPRHRGLIAPLWTVDGKSPTRN